MYKELKFQMQTHMEEPTLVNIQNSVPWNAPLSHEDKYPASYSISTKQSHIQSKQERSNTHSSFTNYCIYLKSMNYKSLHYRIVTDKTTWLVTKWSIITFAVISSEQEASNEPVGSHLTQLTSP